MKIRTLLCWMLCLAVAVAWGEEPAKDRPYRMIIDASVSAKLGAEHIELQCVTAFLYKRARVGNAKEIKTYENGNRIYMLVNGEFARESQMNREKLTIKTPQGQRETYAKDMPENMRAEYLKNFSEPLLQVEVDETGAVLSRKVRERAQEQNGPDLSENYLLFHGKYLGEGKSWDEEHGVNGTGGVTKGPLKHENIGAVEGHSRQHRVKVTGVMNLKKAQFAPGIFMDIKYDVKGEKIYDEEAGDYVTGTFELTLNGSSTKESTVAGSMSGTLKVSLEPDTDEKK